MNLISNPTCNIESKKFADFWFSAHLTFVLAWNKSFEHFKMLKDSLWLRFFNLSDLSVCSLHFLSDLHQISIKQNGQYFVLYPRLSWIPRLTKYRQGSPESASVAAFIDKRQTSWSSRWVQLNLKQGNHQTFMKS